MARPPKTIQLEIRMDSRTGKPDVHTLPADACQAPHQKHPCGRGHDRVEWYTKEKGGKALWVVVFRDPSPMRNGKRLFHAGKGGGKIRPHEPGKVVEYDYDVFLETESGKMVGSDPKIVVRERDGEEFLFSALMALASDAEDVSEEAEDLSAASRELSESARRVAELLLERNSSGSGPEQAY